MGYLVRLARISPLFWKGTYEMINVNEHVTARCYNTISIAAIYDQQSNALSLIITRAEEGNFSRVVCCEIDINSWT